MWSRRPARLPMPSEPYGKLASNAGRPFASSTGRKAVWTPSRALECDCIRFFVRPKSSRGASVPKGLVERKELTDWYFQARDLLRPEEEDLGDQARVRRRRCPAQWLGQA